MAAKCGGDSKPPHRTTTGGVWPSRFWILLLLLLFSCYCCGSASDDMVVVVTVVVVSASTVARSRYFMSFIVFLYNVSIPAIATLEPVIASTMMSMGLSSAADGAAVLQILPANTGLDALTAVEVAVYSHTTQFTLSDIEAFRSAG